MTVEPNMVFLATRSHGHLVSLEAVERAVLESDFTVDGYKVGTDRETLARWAPPLVSAPDKLQLAHERRQLQAMVRHRDGILEMRIYVNWWEDSASGQLRIRVGAVSFQVGLFAGSAAIPYAEQLLGLGRNLYSALEPDFGWADLIDPAGKTWFQHIDALEIPYLYWANFYGPRYIAKLGKKAFLNVPFWDVRDLSDGGLGCVLSPDMRRLDADLSAEEILRMINLGRAQVCNSNGTAR